MDAAMFPHSRQRGLAGGPHSGELVPAAEFQKLLVSHRRLVRVDRRADHVRGLRDLDTGEVFLTDERRLLDRRA